MRLQAFFQKFISDTGCAGLECWGKDKYQMMESNKMHSDASLCIRANREPASKNTISNLKNILKGNILMSKTTVKF